jgi:hypothetical protein
MVNQEAVKLLIQVAHLAQQKGLLALSDAVKVAEAIDVLQPKQAKIGGGILGSPRVK